MMRKHREDMINLDLDCFLFRNDDLDYEEYYYLENHGYEYGEFVPIGKNCQEEFLIKKNTRESLGHTFLVHNIKQELEKCGVEVKTYITVKPDLIFTTKKNKIFVVEVETGKQFRRRKQRIKNNFEKVKQKYSNVVIVVTTTKVKRHYQRLLPNNTIMVRTDIQKWIASLKKNKEL
ncbi:hypothetical protein JXA48_03365 [Candidatus Woesearchaeota archaeon]|nr:hypothetical protein [Candidatus Woesearchaeota archaeon]